MPIGETRALRKERENWKKPTVGQLPRASSAPAMRVSFTGFVPLTAATQMLPSPSPILGAPAATPGRRTTLARPWSAARRESSLFPAMAGPAGPEGLGPLSRLALGLSATA